jgi:hypothetical protein
MFKSSSCIEIDTSIKCMKHFYKEICVPIIDTNDVKK